MSRIPSLRSLKSNSTYNSTLLVAQQPEKRSVKSLSVYSLDPLTQQSFYQARLLRSKSLAYIKKQLQLKKLTHQRTLAKIDSKIKQSLLKFNNLEKKNSQQNSNLRKKKKGDHSQTLSKMMILKKNKQENCKNNQFNSNIVNMVIQKVPFQVKNQCFPISRYGSSLCLCQNRLFLFGGQSSKGMKDPILLHKFVEQQQNWKAIQNISTPIRVPNMYQRVEVFKNYILIIGGINIDIKRQKRLYASNIVIFDSQKEEWDTIPWDRSLRSHSTTIYGNIIVVNGGIDQQDRQRNQTFFLTLYEQKPSRSVIYQMKTDSEFVPHQTNKNDQTNIMAKIFGNNHKIVKDGFSFHSMVNTLEISGTLRSKLVIDGVISFGGIDKNGKLNNDIRCLKVSNDYIGDLQTFKKKKWEIASTYGLKPRPRREQSMNILLKQQLCIVVGGKDEQGFILNDIWVLSLKTANWYKAKVTCDFITQVQMPFCSHASTVQDQRIIIYGNAQSNQQNGSLWVLSNDGNIWKTMNWKKNSSLTKENGPKIQYFSKKILGTQATIKQALSQNLISEQLQI